MTKQIIVTFDFDSETNSVSNVQCTVDGVEKKKRTTKKKSEVEEEMAAEAVITLEPNKLVFNNKAAADLDIKYEDRIIIKWTPNKKTKKLYPVIGKDVAFDEEGSGNKVTKSNTITYKGKSNTMLAELGTSFTLINGDNGIFELSPLNGSINNAPQSLEETIEVAELVEPDLLVDLDETTEIDEIKFKL
jgi:hypothetical protein